MGRSVTLQFVFNRHETTTVEVELDDEDLVDYEDPDDIDPWDYIDRANERADYADWETYDSDTESAVVMPRYTEWEDDEDEDEDEEAPRQPMPALDVLVGRLVIDGDGAVYEVEEVVDDQLGVMTLLDVDTGERTDDYDGQRAWRQGIPPGFYRWYRSGDHVIVHDGSHQTVVGVSAGTVTLLNGQVYEWSQTYDWTWEEEHEEEATA